MKTSAMKPIGIWTPQSTKNVFGHSIHKNCSTRRSKGEERPPPPRYNVGVVKNIVILFAGGRKLFRSLAKISNGRIANIVSGGAGG